ncbi:MAG TPA: DUF4112 domain-containing protein [Desulfuromonadales bacterium]|nr:DUF4112 domain-containing protein [Desulfuromonadales bacterium]
MGVVVLTEQEERILKRIEALSQLLDGAWRIPGTKSRIGIDPLIGLFPVVGDAVSAALSAWTILEARKLGLSAAVQGRMAWNLLIDAAAGSVPVLGDLFDVGFRANTKNLALIHRALDERDTLSGRTG